MKFSVSSEDDKGGEEMISVNLQSMITDDVVLESMNDMRLAQPAKDRLHYFDVVMEGTAESNAIILQKLYTDIISKSNIDFGNIPDSRGNLIKYTGYSLMQQSMGLINQLFQGVASDEVTMMNQLHDMIISCKKDYEFGYSFDIEIIKLAYCLAVSSLYEMINICILAYTKKMRSDANIEFDFSKVKKKDVLILSNTKSLLKSYTSGQWGKMIAALKKDPHMLDTEVANEAAGSIFGQKVSFGEGVKAVVGSIQKIPKAIAIPVAIVAALISLLFIIRNLIYIFYSGSIKIKDYAKTQKEFVDLAIQQEKEDGEPDVIIKRHTKLSERLSSIANFIEVKILHTNQKAKDELATSNKENYNAGDFKPTFGGNIEF
jgi:hypothetical protein